MKKSLPVTDHYLDYLGANRSGCGLASDQNSDNKIQGKTNVSVLFFSENLESSKCHPIFEALARQTWSDFEIIMVQDSGSIPTPQTAISESRHVAPVTVTTFEKLDAVLNESETQWLAFLGPRAVPWPNCLAELKSAWCQNPDCRLIYGDEDRSLLDAGERHFFKPDFSVELLLSTNYIGELFFIRKDLYHKIGGIRHLAVPDAFHDLLLRVSETTTSVVHIPKILHSVSGQAALIQESGGEIIKAALSRRKVTGAVSLLPDKSRSVWRIQPQPPGRSKVSIIILTAYQDAERNLLPCLRSIADHSTYHDYEIILVDNSHGTLIRSEVRGLFPENIPVKIIDYPDPFNFPKMNNLAVAHAQGQYLALLNDDIEINTPDWMEQMMGLAALPDVGIVGCKLLFPDRTIQHAGVIILPTGPTHACRFTPAEYTGYNALLAGLTNWSAVTFACVMIPADVYDQVGGMSEAFSVEFNDVDFCLKAGERGYRTVYTPFVEQYHKESASRRHTDQVGVCGDLEKFRKRWPALMKDGDPFFNPNLSLTSECFTFNPTKEKS